MRISARLAAATAEERTRSPSARLADQPAAIAFISLRSFKGHIKSNGHFPFNLVDLRSSNYKEDQDIRTKDKVFIQADDGRDIFKISSYRRTDF